MQRLNLGAAKVTFEIATKVSDCQLYLLPPLIPPPEKILSDCQLETAPRVSDSQRFSAIKTTKSLPESAILSDSQPKPVDLLDFSETQRLSAIVSSLLGSPAG